jgi:hypothetical protein
LWLCFNNAFVSVTRDDNNPARVMVRARNPDHLKALLGPEVNIRVTPDSDYHYRTFVDRKVWADLVSRHIMDIDYGNFKASVVDTDLHDMYIDFWNAHYEYQSQIELKAELEAKKAEIDQKKVEGRQQPSMPSIDPAAAMAKINAIIDAEED